MRILLIFIFCFFAVASMRAAAYDLDDAAKDIDTNLEKEFFLEAKYFFLMRLYQNTDDALSNTMPHPFGLLIDDGFDDVFDDGFEGVPSPFKRMVFRSLSQTIKAQYGDEGILSKIDGESSSSEGTFLGPALRFTLFHGHMRIGVRPDFDKGNFSSLEELPIKPVAFVNIGRGPFRVGFSYNPIQEEVRASLKFHAEKERIVFRQNLKVPLDHIDEASTSSDVTYKIWENKHIYLGGAFRTNIRGFDEPAGMIILYGFW